MKAKTHSGSQKRVKVTATGKFRTAKIGKRHLLQNKSSQAKGRGKYGAATHIANERKMKWGHQVAGLRTPTAKRNIVEKDANGKIIKAPRRAPVIKAVKAPVVKAPKAQTTVKAAPAKKTAKKTTKKSAA
jgi:ribosomal protein L35